MRSRSLSPSQTPKLLRRCANGMRFCAMLLLGALASVQVLHAQKDMVEVPAGKYSPLLQAAGEKAQEVPAFLIDVHPVTNGEFLAFVRTHPKWQRSKVGKLFADTTYLQHWHSDLELGPSAPERSPVVNVSWFAARAYAAFQGKRLPSSAEWERAASAGYHTLDGRNDTVLLREIYQWLAKPTPALLPNVDSAGPNAFGIRALYGFVWEWVDDFNTAMVTGESRADSGPDRNLFCGGASVGARDTADYAAFMRLALRSSLKASNTTTSLGFRCAATPKH